ncbi:MAG: thiolase family protein [Paracoccus sp. (in: a-proteobacteria)]|uniref:thiolase family protein n=1 Tax=Paracoccus sp. TaxID=267 RepID=UPI0039E5DF89
MSTRTSSGPSVVISGVGQTAVGRLDGSSSMGLQAEAVRLALADSGLRLGDIDAVLCAYSIVEPHIMLSSAFCEFVGLRPGYSTAMQSGGATACAMVMHAAALIKAGAARHVLAVTGDNRLSGMSRDAAVSKLAEVGHPQFEQPYGISIPAAYALVARAYMTEFGVREEDLAAIAVAMRANAAQHPDAQMKAPITVDDVMNSKVIATPLKLLDCCLISDGAAALIISAADTVPDLAAPATDVLGYGMRGTHEHIFAAPSLTHFGCTDAAHQAFTMAGVTPADIDVTEIYDSFTITLLAELESIGFFEKGEAGPAAAEGALSVTGRVPCNTHGGLLSFAHSGAAGGMFHIVEAVRQLRRTAAGRQVEGAELAYVHGDGGILSLHSSLVLGRR